MNILVGEYQAGSSLPLAGRLLAIGHEVSTFQTVDELKSLLKESYVDVVMPHLNRTWIEENQQNAAKVHECVRIARQRQIWTAGIVDSAGELNRELIQRFQLHDFVGIDDTREVLEIRCQLIERHVYADRDRLRELDELRRRCHMLEYLINVLPDGYLIVDNDGKIVQANEHAGRMFEYEPSEFDDITIEELVHPELRERHKSYREKFQAQKLTRQLGSGTVLNGFTKSGKSIPLEIGLATLELEEKQATMSVVRDIRDRLEVEQKLQESLQKLNETHIRLEENLEHARRIQESLLPQEQLEHDEVTFSWEWQECEKLGGDCLDIFELDDEHTGMFMIDISGHGIPAALMSVSIVALLSPRFGPTSMLRTPRATGQRFRFTPPAIVAEDLNETFLDHPTRYQYFTLFYGILNRQKRRLRFLSAGHPGIIRIPPTKPATFEAYTNYPVGLIEDATYIEQVIQLEPGERVILCSDGIFEAMPDRSLELYGTERATALVEQLRQEPLDVITAHLKEDALQWSRGTFHDDVSIIGFEMK